MTEMEMIQTRMNGFDNKMIGLERQVHEIGINVSHINKTMDTIDTFLRGNDFDKTDQGLIGEHNKLKDEVAELKRFKDKMTWVMVGMGIVTGLNIPMLFDMIRKAFANG